MSKQEYRAISGTEIGIAFENDKVARKSAKVWEKAHRLITKHGRYTTFIRCEGFPYDLNTSLRTIGDSELQLALCAKIEPVRETVNYVDYLDNVSIVAVRNTDDPLPDMDHPGEVAPATLVWQMNRGQTLPLSEAKEGMRYMKAIKRSFKHQREELK